jgi:hypothetical protein
VLVALSVAIDIDDVDAEVVLRGTADLDPLKPAQVPPRQAEDGAATQAGQ